ncbi:MAG: hypothetical protein ACYCTF_04325 [Acidiferrobacter sp.]
MIDAVNLLRVRVGSGPRGVKDARREENVGILEPFEIIGDGGFRRLVPQGFQIAGQIVDGIQGARMVDQPMRQIRNRLGVRNIMVLYEVAEQYGVEIFLLRIFILSIRSRPATSGKPLVSRYSSNVFLVESGPRLSTPL